MLSNPNPDSPWRLSALPFALVHLGALATPFLAPVSWRGVGLAAALYAVRMFAVPGGGGLGRAELDALAPAAKAALEGFEARRRARC